MAFRNLTAFFNGAFQANSGGKAKPEDFAKLDADDCMQAEQELTDIVACYRISPSALGAMADAGYTLHGQTNQNATEDPDDEQHQLMAYTLLDTLY
jgi:hypothetical protein